MTKKTYAVVDIETTGTDPKKDRIIQLGCVLVQDGEIVTKFAVDINPGQGIPLQIQKLTGITNAQVQKAPYFEDVALTVYNLLAETTFVAHNIHFDFNFLNAELKRCGASPLKIPGIDTVELAQIFLPTEVSFRLSDLSESLGLVHTHPHQADSDAEVTAQLFLRIQQEMRQLPLVTMEKIAKTASVTSRDTGSFIKQICQEMRDAPKKLQPDIEIIAGLALRKKTVPLYTAPQFTLDYPRRKAGKVKRFGEVLNFRKDQARLMNLVYDHYCQEEHKELMVEAATGSGKTLGYLFPLSYLATAKNPAIISTVSLLLQQQIMEADIPKLNQILEHPLQAVVVKSPRHYVNLQRFNATFAQETTHKQYGMYQMMVLTWLTKTVTGDVDELHMTSFQHPFWQEIGHRGIDELLADNPFYEADFLRHLYKKIKQSNVIIVNHAFLAQEDLRKTPALPRSAYLLIDEAHHLPEIAERTRGKRLDVEQFRHKVQHLTAYQVFEQWQEILPQQTELQRLLRIYQTAISEISEDLWEYYQELLTLIPEAEEYLIEKECFSQLSAAGVLLQKRLLRYCKEAQTIGEQIQSFLIREKEQLSEKELLLWGDWQLFYQQFVSACELLEPFCSLWDFRYLHWVRRSQRSGILHFQDLEGSNIAESLWYQRYDKVLFLGGSLKVAGKSNFLSERLGLPQVKLKVLMSPYDYQQQARLFIPKEGLALQESSAKELAYQLAQMLSQLIATEKRPILVLFTSHELLQKVYHQLKTPLLLKGRELLAQGIGGSREKLLKRFRLSEAGILFGADSFWEGVDLPGTTLEILVVTRLPFENPNRPLVKARNEFLEAKGRNAFYDNALPKAALRLRQALGRLIRSEQDRGVMIVLDRRLLTARYSKELLAALPKELPVEELPYDELLQTAQNFLATCETKPQDSGSQN